MVLCQFSHLGAFRKSRTFDQCCSLILFPLSAVTTCVACCTELCKHVFPVFSATLQTHYVNATNNSAVRPAGFGEDDICATHTHTHTRVHTNICARQSFQKTHSFFFLSSMPQLLRVWRYFPMFHSHVSLGSSMAVKHGSASNVYLQGLFIRTERGCDFVSLSHKCTLMLMSSDSFSIPLANNEEHQHQNNI